MKIFEEISFLKEFDKDFKRLKKRYKTLEEDLTNFIQHQLKLYHKLQTDNKGVFQIKDLKIEYPRIFKATKFTCMSLKGKGVQTGIRVIYAYHEKEDTLDFIEIYFKGDKSSEDRKRIEKYYKK